MKHSLFICLLIISIDTFGQSNYIKLPHGYNRFTTKATISWAAEVVSIHSFPLSPDPSLNLSAYLQRAQTNQQLNSYITEDYDTAQINRWKTTTAHDYFVPVNASYQSTYQQPDSLALNATEFMQVLYLEDHRLKSDVIAAGNLFKVVTSTGIYLGNTVLSYTGLNDNHTAIPSRKKNCLLLGTTRQLLPTDSLENKGSIKKTYGHDLMTQLWLDAAAGYNTVTDLSTRQTIPANQIMDYSPLDSVATEAPVDTVGLFFHQLKHKPAIDFFDQVAIEQDWYFDTRKHRFYAIVRKALLYLKDKEGNNLLAPQLRFEISFIP